MKFGEYFRERRMAMGLSARKFASEKGYDVGYISRLENGLMAPPAEPAKVEALGRALGLKVGTEEWQEFLDLVAVARNELPGDLSKNENIVKMLPAFYRSLRAAELNEAEIKRLLKLISGTGQG